MLEYDDFRHLQVSRTPDGILNVVINRPDVYNAANERLHWELSEIWQTFDADPLARVALVTGAGRAFSAGGDLQMVENAHADVYEVKRQLKHTSAVVTGIMATDKPIVSAINGVAVGAGVAVALLADISVMAESARISDGHMRLGVSAGDHAAMLWPLLCGMAKAKYYLLTADFISGPEAERIGLVSRCVPDDELLSVASEICTRLATGPQTAQQWTKRALNQWLYSAMPIFQHSLALEMLSLLDDDVTEGLAALKAKTEPKFPSTSRPLDNGEAL